MRPKPPSADITIPSPIKQYPNGRKGAYELLLLEHKPLTLPQFQEMARTAEARLASRSVRRALLSVAGQSRATPSPR